MDFKETGTSQPGELYTLLHFPFMFLRVIWLFIIALALRKLAFIDNSRSSCSLSIRQILHFRRYEGALGPTLIFFLASPWISSSLLSSIMHWWHFVICEKDPLCCSHESGLPPGSPELPGSYRWKVLEPRHKAMRRECCKTTQSCLLEAEHGEEQYVTVDNEKVSKCDLKPGLQFTGKMILPE